MATIADPLPRRSSPLDADGYERVLSVAAIILFCFVIAALARGYPYWAKIPSAIWVHLATIMIAVALTPVMLLRRRGDRPHRRLGTIWVLAMIATALISFTVRNANHGHFSFIHILSAWTLVQVPILWWAAKTHRIVRHRRSVRAMVTGALLIAGFFTFPFNRLLGQFLFG